MIACFAYISLKDDIRFIKDADSVSNVLIELKIGDIISIKGWTDMHVVNVFRKIYSDQYEGDIEEIGITCN